jgi:hypothetical protein
MTTSYGEIPGTFTPLNTLSPLSTDLRRKPGTADSIALDEEYVPMNTSSMPIIPKAIQDLLDELEASKQSRLCAWNALRKLRLFFPGWKRCDSVTGPETLARRHYKQNPISSEDLFEFDKH